MQKSRILRDDKPTKMMFWQKTNRVTEKKEIWKIYEHGGGSLVTVYPLTTVHHALER